MLSIIIPARNDAAAPRHTLDHLEALDKPRSLEVVVAASGDVEGTNAAVRDRAVLRWPGGSTRADLMNTVAAVAQGDVLLFLHADSLPPLNAWQLIDAALEDGAVGGAFEQRFAEPDWRLRVISAIDRVRYRPHAQLLRRSRHVREDRCVPPARRISLTGAHGRSRFLTATEAAWRHSTDHHTNRDLRPKIPPPGTLAHSLSFAAGSSRCGRSVSIRYAERWRGPADRAPGARWSQQPGK
jgi:glycosyltransferase involved in cell wall biosynthesis